MGTEIKYIRTEAGKNAGGNDDIGQLMCLLTGPMTRDEIECVLRETETCDFAIPATIAQHRSIIQALDTHLRACLSNGLIKVFRAS